MKWQRIIGPLLVALGLLVLALNLNWIRIPPPQAPAKPAPPAAAGKKAAAKQAPQSATLKNRLLEQAARYVPYVNTGKAYNPFALAPLGLGAVLLIWSFTRKRKAAAATRATADKAAPSIPAKAKPAGRAPRRWHCCNVLNGGAEARQLWQFDAGGDRFTLNREQTAPAGEPLPGHLIRKTWRSLWQPKLNVAWLPAEHVFLRVAKFPQSSFDEMLAMVELQLEKLSPLPVTHIVWSVHVMSGATDGFQTVIVIIASRSLVEEFLGQLEGKGYLADRLELPLLDQLQTTPIAGDGAWVYPDRAAAHARALVAWWYGGSLQQLDLISLPVGVDRTAVLKEQLAQMTWAGELDGWLAAPPRWHLVAEAAMAADWQPLLRDALGEPVEVLAPLSAPELAAATARRAANAPAKANLLPGEFALRYHQQFVDRLWMRGLGAVLSLYVVGVLVYFVALEFLLFRTRTVENKVVALSETYTNAIQLKARCQVLQDRQELKYAALDCWKTAAEHLPQSLTLDTLDFKEGKKLTLGGTAPRDQYNQLLDFNEAMRKATVKDKPMFKKFGDLSSSVVGGGTSVAWNFSCELNRTETQ